MFRIENGKVVFSDESPEGSDYVFESEQDVAVLVAELNRQRDRASHFHATITSFCEVLLAQCEARGRDGSIDVPELAQLIQAVSLDTLLTGVQYGDVKGEIADFAADKWSELVEGTGLDGVSGTTH